MPESFSVKKISLPRQPATSKYAAFPAGEYVVIQHNPSNRYYRYAYVKVGVADLICETINNDFARYDDRQKILDIAVNFVEDTSRIIISELSL